MNDYNAMLLHKGVYHFTYQDHLNCPDDVAQSNQSFGHVASPDLVHLVHLPPALIDDPSYDGGLGPWDGPGFVCNGVPTIIYNSHFRGGGFGEQTKTAATPVNVSDAWLRTWSRTPLTPSDAFLGPGTLAPPWLSTDGSHYYTFSAPTRGAGGPCWLWSTPSNGNCSVWSVVTQNMTDDCPVNSPEVSRSVHA